MILVPKGDLRLWPDFVLRVPEEIMLTRGNIYHLAGTNGSGKSSFIRNFLLRYEPTEPVYRLYFEQQMSSQLQAVKAIAAFAGQSAKVERESDAVSYLLDDLERCMQKEPRPLWIFADESRFLDMILSHPAVQSAHALVLYCEHGPARTGSKTIMCKALDLSLSEARDASV